MGGDFQTTVASLAKWPSERLRARGPASSETTASDIREVRAAVMLHSDVAIFLAAADPLLSSEQLDAARALVATLPDEGPSGFRDRWQAYALGPYLVQKNDLYRATLAVNEAVGRFPRSADLALMQGTLLELSARVTTDVREPSSPRPTSSSSPIDQARTAPVVRARRSEETLSASAVTLERAVALNPALVSAHLRLGWVYGINNSSGHARDQLRLVLNSTSSPELLYLAHLFLARLADTDGNSEGAYQEYEAAHRLQPEAQSAWIALIRSAAMTGRTTRERELIEQYATRTKTVEDPWWYFSMGFDTELVTWLHGQATSR